LLFEDRTILINSYNIETILAEKIETILRRGKFNSRMKDFYDIYYFLTKLRNEINIEILKKAIKNTFIKRGSIDYLSDYEKIINSIINDDRMKKIWKIYCGKYKYVNDININKILDILMKFIKELDLMVIVG